jgi:hypothetical protein
MEKTMKTGSVGKLAAESRFTYGGVEWVVLEHNLLKEAVLVLAADVLKTESGETRYMPFDEENKNDFAASSVRAFLNGDFLEELAAAGADKEAFLPLALDLTSDDGLKDYGIDKVTIGIYTDQIYREFRNIIPPASDWHWTATPFSTARNGYEHLVRYVNSSGALSYSNAYIGNRGVRPLCVLKSDILVSFNEDEVKERTPSFGEMLAQAIMQGVQEAFSGGDSEEPEEAAPAEEPEAAADQPDSDGEASALYARFAALKRAGFTETQALELVSGKGK